MSPRMVWRNRQLHLKTGWLESSDHSGLKEALSHIDKGSKESWLAGCNEKTKSGDIS